MKRKAFFAVVGVFLLGFVGGTLLGQLYPVGHLWGRPWHEFKDGSDIKQHARGGKRGSHTGRYIGMLRRELDLSEGQMAEIGPLLGQTRRELYQARIRSHRESDRIVMEFHGRITPKLDEAQVRKLEQLTERFLERRDKKRRRMMSRLESLGAGN